MGLASDDNACIALSCDFSSEEKVKMLIVGDNLRDLVDQYGIIRDKRCFDNSSLSLSIDRELIYVEPSSGSEIVYGRAIPEKWLRRSAIPDEGMVLAPKSGVLGCSRESVSMPLGYFGLLQTKGSLSRLFVVVNCCDGQIEGGYSGKITFEIVNLASFGVRLSQGDKVGQLFIFKTSTRAVEPYAGRYQGAQGPTVALPEE